MSGNFQFFSRTRRPNPHIASLENGEVVLRRGTENLKPIRGTSRTKREFRIVRCRGVQDEVYIPRGGSEDVAADFELLLGSGGADSHIVACGGQAHHGAVIGPATGGSGAERGAGDEELRHGRDIGNFKIIRGTSVRGEQR